MTLSFSRHMFVWPTLTRTVTDVCEGLDEAWRFFGGIPKRAVLDNASSTVTVPSAQAPVLQRSFQEYAQARGILVDPARVRRPQDKGRVENAVPYVRERWCDGERFLDLADSRRSAARWCDEVAGARVHGTTRAVPREVFAAGTKWSASRRLARVPWPSTSTTSRGSSAVGATIPPSPGAAPTVRDLRMLETPDADMTLSSIPTW